MAQSSGDALSQSTKLAGNRYVLEAVLGQGGFGITYRATDTLLHRTVAIKELFPIGCQRQGSTVGLPQGYTPERWQKLVDSFLLEAQTLAQLDDRGILHVYEYLRENSTAYIVMKFIDGVNLMQLVKRRGPLPEAEALRYIAEVGAALSVLHSSHFLHRDIKPDNIIVGRNGHAVLVDFGAARAYRPDVSLIQSVIYTRGFVPPEQLLPKARRGPQSDIYALAATCYYLLTGEIPQSDDEGNLDDEGRIRPQLKAVLEQAMADNLADRPADVRAFLSEIERSTGTPLPAAPHPTSYPDSTVPEARSRPYNLPTEREQSYSAAEVQSLEGAAGPQQHSRAVAGISVGIAILLLLVLAIILLNGNRQNESSAQATQTPFVAVVITTTPTSLLAAAAKTPVVIAVVPPTDTPLPTATPISPSPTSAPTDTPAPTDTLEPSTPTMAPPTSTPEPPPTEAPTAPTAITVPASQLPDPMFGDLNFKKTWERFDLPVAQGKVSRTWFWGPVGAKPIVLYERYDDVPNGGNKRLVQYFDKSRMEVNNPAGDRSQPFFVTNGLLVVELITGKLQIGDNTFEQHSPAQIDIASDLDDATAPTYASFTNLNNVSGADRIGQYAVQTINHQGQIGSDQSKANIDGAKLVYYERIVQHNVPKVFWDFLNDRIRFMRMGHSSMRL